MRGCVKYRWPRVCWLCLLMIALLGMSGASSHASVGRTATATARDGHADARIGATVARAHQVHWHGSQAPNDASCRADKKIGQPCYSPQELQRAYNLTPLLQRGFTGKGQTIVIIDSFGSPTVEQDLKRFDKDYGLPDPPVFKQLAPLGTVPFDENNSDQVGWAQETNLDVQWAHAMAPQAGIIVLTSPISETQGVQGMPEFLKLEQYALEHHLGAIINQSWSTAENTLFTKDGKQKVLIPFEQFYQRAASNNISIFAASGDTGVANVDVNNKTYSYPTVGYPAASPWVMSVGGTSLKADVQGKYQEETVWHFGDGASGGGISQSFAEPTYQQRFLPASIQTILKSHRAIPDISMNADPATAVPVYLGFGAQRGYVLFGGTSESAPLWCGLTAIANQYAGHNLGFLNPRLYQLGADNRLRNQVFHDIVSGNNSVGKLSGYAAFQGWDLATGWGSPNGDPLIQALKR